MPRKRARVPVVFDTNLLVTRFIKHNRHGINRRVMDLWQTQRKLQLIISPPVKLEYLRVLEAYAGIAPDVLKLLEARLDTASYVTQVNHGTRVPSVRGKKSAPGYSSIALTQSPIVSASTFDLWRVPIIPPTAVRGSLRIIPGMYQDSLPMEL